MERKTVVIAQSDLERQKAVCEQIREYWLAQGRTPLAFVDTYGCQQNEADSERIRGMLQSCGYQLSDTEEGADCIVINTCAIREHAETRVYGNVGALVHTKARHPGQKIFLCGCMMGQPAVADRIKKSYRHVDGVFNPHQLWRFPELLQFVLAHNKRIFATDDSAGNIAEGLPVVRTSDLKAWVSIMYGCNNFCSYCIVPYVRGRERSRDPQYVLREVRELVEAGYKDITLLGQNVNSYGNDLEGDYRFPDLLEDIDKIPGEYLIRFMSSHPKDATNRLFDVMAKCSHVAKQLHLPVQSGNDRVLKEMNRRYTREKYLEEVRYARSVMPGLVITSDIIIGFPGETEEEFAQTKDTCTKAGFARMHVFPYSEREGTKAALMPDSVPRHIREERARELIALGRTLEKNALAARIGKEEEVLVEEIDEQGNGVGYTGGYMRVCVKDGKPGEIVRVRITGADDEELTGEMEK